MRSRGRHAPRRAGWWTRSVGLVAAALVALGMRRQHALATRGRARLWTANPRQAGRLDQQCFNNSVRAVADQNSPGLPFAIPKPPVVLRLREELCAGRELTNTADGSQGQVAWRPGVGRSPRLTRSP